MAAAIGRVLGIGLIAAGFLAIGFLGLVTGAWLVVIGWFVLMCACSGLLEINRRICYVRKEIGLACVGSALSLALLRVFERVMLRAPGT